jgi:hypothetical protein
MDMPDRLRHGDDATEDVTAPKPGSKHYMNQSLFNMITAAGSTADFHTRFDGASSDSEGDVSDGSDGGVTTKLLREQRYTKSKVPAGSVPTVSSSSSLDAREHKHLRGSSKQTSIRTMPKLHLRSIKERNTTLDEPMEDNMMSSQILAPPPKVQGIEDSSSGDAPLLSRMLKGEAEMQASDQADYAASSGVVPGKKRKPAPVSLAERLKDIFGLDEPENVISGMEIVHYYISRTRLTLSRISVLVSPNRAALWVYVSHREAYLLLRISPQELCMFHRITSTLLYSQTAGKYREVGISDKTWSAKSAISPLLL